MRDYQKQNIEEALQTIAKLEILLKMCDVQGRDLDLLNDKLWRKWKEETKKIQP